MRLTGLGAVNIGRMYAERPRASLRYLRSWPEIASIVTERDWDLAAGRPRTPTSHTNGVAATTKSADQKS